MIIHQVINPDFCDQGHIIGWTQDRILKYFCYLFYIFYPFKLTIHDFNRILAVEMTHDDLRVLHDQIMPMMVAHTQPDRINPNGSVAMNIPVSRFPELVDTLNRGNFTRGSPNIVHSILACVGQMTLATHGRLNACHVQVYLHADAEPRGFI